VHVSTSSSPSELSSTAVRITIPSSYSIQLVLKVHGKIIRNLNQKILKKIKIRACLTPTPADNPSPPGDYGSSTNHQVTGTDPATGATPFSFPRTSARVSQGGHVGRLPALPGSSTGDLTPGRREGRGDHRPISSLCASVDISPSMAPVFKAAIYVRDALEHTSCLHCHHCTDLFSRSAASFTQSTQTARLPGADDGRRNHRVLHVRRRRVLRQALPLRPLPQPLPTLVRPSSDSPCGPVLISTSTRLLTHHVRRDAATARTTTATRQRRRRACATGASATAAARRGISTRRRRRDLVSNRSKRRQKATGGASSSRSSGPVAGSARAPQARSPAAFRRAAGEPAGTSSSKTSCANK
jgi:hypothetical protein